MEEKKKEPSPQWLIVVSAAVISAYTLCIFLFSSNWRNGFLVLLSGLFGFILKFGPFGYTCTFKSMIVKQDFSEYRDMLIMLFTGTLLCSIFEMFPSLRPLFPTNPKATLSNSSAPIGLSLVIGSFLFGIGMQLGLGCASGTFVGIGGGFLKAYVVLPFFIIGATIFTLNPFYNFWSKLPKTKKKVTIPFYCTLLILLYLYGITLLIDFLKEKKKKDRKELISDDNGDTKQLIPPENEKDTEKDIKEKEESKSTIKFFFVIFFNQYNNKYIKLYSSLHNVIVAVSIGIVISLFYLCVGSMIGVMGVFSYIGAYFLKLFGATPEQWDFFNGKLPKNMFDVTIFNSDLLMAMGAFVAASIKGVFGKSQNKGAMEYVKGMIGGLLMGMGARMAGGCNIGAMTSGITSSSLHGFIWMFSAILGSFCMLKSDIVLKMFSKKKVETKEEEK